MQKRFLKLRYLPETTICVHDARTMPASCYEEGPDSLEKQCALAGEAT